MTFLRDALACVEAAHPSHSGKLVMFLLRKFLVSPHLSLTRHANAVLCARVEAMLAAGNVAGQLTRDDVKELVDTLR